MRPVMHPVSGLKVAFHRDCALAKAGNRAAPKRTADTTFLILPSVTYRQVKIDNGFTINRIDIRQYKQSRSGRSV